MPVDVFVSFKKRLSSATGIWKVNTKSTYDINSMKCRDILDLTYFQIENSVNILAILR